jgi:hypothetical protein
LSAIRNCPQFGVVRNSKFVRGFLFALLCREMAIEVFSASLFLWPVQSLGELNPGNGVDKRSELVIRQIRAEALKPSSYVSSNADEFLKDLWVLE